MTIENNSAAGTDVPAVTDTSTVTPPAATTPNVGEPEWLPKRIEQAKKNAEADLLKSLGFASADEAKAMATAAKARAEADKTAETRAAELAAKLDGESKAKDATLAVVKEHAARMLIGLTAEQKAAVEALAGDDPVKTLHTITALAPTWAASAAAVVASTTTVAAKTADTAPPPGAPNGKTPPAPDARATFEAMQRTNPFAAAAYATEHPEVFDSK